MVNNSISSENFNSFSYWQFDNNHDVLDDCCEEDQCPSHVTHECGDYLSASASSCYYYEMKFDDAVQLDPREAPKNPSQPSQSLITTTRFLHTTGNLSSPQTKKVQLANSVNLVVNDLIDIYDLTDDLDRGFLLDEPATEPQKPHDDTGVFSRFKNLIGLSTHKPSVTSATSGNLSLTPTGKSTHIWFLKRTLESYWSI
jgi:hypothetical protein